MNLCDLCSASAKEGCGESDCEDMGGWQPAAWPTWSLAHSAEQAPGPISFPFPQPHPTPAWSVLTELAAATWSTPFQCPIQNLMRKSEAAPCVELYQGQRGEETHSLQLHPHLVPQSGPRSSSIVSPGNLLGMQGPSPAG